MMGLMVLGFFVVYLFVSIGVTEKAVSWAKANNKKPWLWGGLAAFVMYNLVFWDLIPTLVMHKYYCATQAGFWVYKTPEQWMRENPKMKDIVTYAETSSDDFKQELIDNGNKTTFTVNKRSKVKFTEVKTSILPLIKNRRVEETLFDEAMGVYLTRKVYFQAGHVRGAPNSVMDFVSLNLDGCVGHKGNSNQNDWQNSVNKFMNLGESND